MAKKKDDWIYIVAQDEDYDEDGHYTVSKALPNGEVRVIYCVTVPADMDAEDIAHLTDEDVQCSCMGFRMQRKYPLVQHKHVQLVFMYLLAKANGVTHDRYMLDKNNKPYAYNGVA